MLRRIAALCLTVTLFVFACSCSKPKPAEKPITTGFECDVAVQYGDMNVKGHLTRSSAGTLQLDISEPETLKGMSMIWNGEKVILKLYGLSFDVNPENIPQSALGLSILKALDAMLSDKGSGEITSEGFITKGVLNGSEFEIISDPSTGKLLSLKIPSLELTANFTNFILLNSTAATAA